MMNTTGTGTFVDPSEFRLEGTKILRKAQGLSSSTFQCRFSSLFGMTPQICTTLWSLLAGLHPDRGQPKHLLWALMFLKVNDTEYVLASLASVDEKTLRLWQ